MNDGDCLEGFLAGDSEAVETVRGWIRAAFSPYVRRFGSEAEDLEQQIMVELLTSLQDGRFQGRSTFSTYVKSCVHHKAIDRLRAAGRRTMVDVDDLDLQSKATSAVDSLLSAEQIRVALRVAEMLPESCRELWRMLHQGMKYQEMSRQLGISSGTLRVRVLRCRQRALEARAKLLSDPPEGTS